MSHVSFPFQDSYITTYRVGGVFGSQQCQFVSIQDAIDAAAADGHISNASPAEIEIYYSDAPGGDYTENLTLRPGISLRGMAPRERVVGVFGNHVYAPTNGLDRGANNIRLERIVLVGVAASVAPTLSLSGTAAAQIAWTDGGISRQGINDGEPAIRIDNTNSDVGIVFKDCNLSYSDSSGTAHAVELDRGQFIMKDASRITSDDCSCFLLDEDSNVTCFGSPSDGATFFAGGLNIFDILTENVTIDLSYCTLSINNAAGTVLDFNNIALTNSGVEIKHSHFDFTDDAITISANGTPGNPQINLGNCTFNYAYNGTVTVGRNAFDVDSLLFSLPSKLRVELNNTAIYAFVGQGGFDTIANAITFLQANAALHAVNFKVLLVSPGNYSEDFTLPNDFVLAADWEQISATNVSSNTNYPVNINGTVTFDSTAGGASYIFGCTLRNNNGLVPALLYTGSSPADLYLQNCSIYVDQNDSAASIECTITANSRLFASNCLFNRLNSNTGIMFDQSGATATLQGFFNNCYFNISTPGPTPTDAAGARVIENGTTGDVSFTFQYCAFESNLCQTPFSVQSGSITFRQCQIQGETDEGTVFYLDGGVVAIILTQVNYVFTTPVAMLARDGTQATALIAQTSNVYAPGDGYNVNGTTFVNGVDFAVGGTAAITATNIAAAINLAGASADPNIENRIFAKANGDNVELESINWQLSANAYTLALIGTAPAVLTAWAGGSDGAGGIYFEGQPVYQSGVGPTFDAVNIQNNINRQLLPVVSVLVP